MKEIKNTIVSLLNEFEGDLLDEKTVHPDPFKQFEHWLKQIMAIRENQMVDMTLSSAGRDAVPCARIVLLRDFDEKGFTFFTNYNSRKGKEIDENPKACLLFYWPELQRQVRIDGILEKVDPAVSENYFKERPRANQISAWISPQSHEVISKEFLESKIIDFEKQYQGKEIPCPPFWGGYILKPSAFEFWQGQMARLHDRIFYEKDGESDQWKIVRLAP